MGFFLLYLSQLPCSTRVPAPSLAGSSVCFSCTGRGSRLGNLAVLAKQSSVTPGMRLWGELFDGCFEESWGREVDALFGVTPSLPFFFPPALLVHSLSNWKEIGGVGARRSGVAGGR